MKLNLLFFCFFLSVNLFGEDLKKSNLNFEEKSPFNITAYQLDNGLEVIVNVNNNAPTVTGIVLVKAGAKDEPITATGLAHYLEHMLFKGTDKIGAFDYEKEKVHLDRIEKLYDELEKTNDENAIKRIQKEINKESIAASKYQNPQEFHNILFSMGASGINASTGYDMTNYYCTVPKNHINKWLQVYAEIFRNPTFRGFQNELEVVYEERNMTIEDSPEVKAYLKKMEAVFDKHKYGVPILGFAEHLKKPQMSEMIKFYEKYYVPNNMTLILSGDVNPEKVLPEIKKTFGKLLYKDFEKTASAEESPFKGRENIQIKYSRSLSEGSLIYRTKKASEENTLVLDLLAMILSNNGRNGFLDELVFDGLLLSVNAYNNAMKEAGIFEITFTPGFEYISKSVGVKNTSFSVDEMKQSSLRTLEKLILKKIDKIKNGEFDELFLERIKEQMSISYNLSLEDNLSQAMILRNFLSRKIPLDYLINFKTYLNNITKDNIVGMANKHLTDDYLAFFNLRGRVRKEYVKKPDIEPLQSNLDENTEFAKKIIEQKAEGFNKEFIDFKNDVKTVLIKPKAKLHYVKNNKNDVFSMLIRYNVGQIVLPNLTYAAPLMNLAGITGQYEGFELRKKFGELSCNYSINSTDNKLYISLFGQEKNLAEALTLMSRLLFIPDIKPEASSSYIKGQAFSRSSIKRYPQRVADAALNYIMYKDESPYKTWTDTEKLMLMGAKEVQIEFDKALNYSVDVFYYGNDEITDVYNTIKQKLVLKPNLVNGENNFRKKQFIDNTKIFFYNNSEATQSTIFVYQKLGAFNKNKIAEATSFNNYFSGSFSGLVLQNIREKMALAYGAGVNINYSFQKKDDFYMTGYTLTQNDKAFDAVKTLVELIKNAPLVDKGMNITKKRMVNSALASSANKRYLAQDIDSYKEMGFEEDPNKILLKKYQQMNNDDILSYYNEYLKNKPIAIVIVGNQKKIDLKKMEEIAPIVKLKESQMIKK